MVGWGGVGRETCRVWPVRPEESSRGGVEAAGQLACALLPLPTRCHRPCEFRRRAGPGVRGQVAWSPARLLWVSPQVWGREQAGRGFGYREAGPTHSASLPALGEDRRSRRAPAGVPGQERRGRAAVGSGMRRVITSAGSLAPRVLPGAEPSSCFWIFTLLSPQGRRHHLFRRPSPYFSQHHTQGHTH